MIKYKINLKSQTKGKTLNEIIPEILKIELIKKINIKDTPHATPKKEKETNQ